MQQEILLYTKSQNNQNADPNLYDILDLTDWGTRKGYINLPNIISDPNFNHSQWIFRSDNYADIAGGEKSLLNGYLDGLPDGKVDKRDLAKLSSYWANTSCDPNNHWCDFTDLDRDGDVNFRDFSRMSLEWLYDTNDPNTFSKLTPKVNGINVLDGGYLKEFQTSSRKLFGGRKEPLYAKEEKETA